MKKIMILLFIATSFTTIAQAQINVNIGKQPLWGPVGYDRADYYYMPDADIYYSVPERAYYYRRGNSNNWTRSTVLPPQYKNVDLFTTQKVVINGEGRPYMNHVKYKDKYASLKGKRDQVAIRDSKDEKYLKFRNKGNNGARVVNSGNGRNGVIIKHNRNKHDNDHKDDNDHKNKKHNGNKGGKGKN